MTAKKALISQLGTVMQIAFVPKDFDAAVRYWTETMGVGPFFHLQHLAMDQAKYRGAVVEIDFSIAIAYWGDLQVEIIQQHNDAPSIYKSWLDEGREGLHHVCIITDDMARARAVCKEAAAAVVQEVLVPGGGEAIYVDAGGGQGGLIEIIDLPQSVYDGFAYMHEQSRIWDGSDPLRSLA